MNSAYFRRLKLIPSSTRTCIVALLRCFGGDFRTGMTFSFLLWLRSKNSVGNVSWFLARDPTTTRGRRLGFGEQKQGCPRQRSAETCIDRTGLLSSGVWRGSSWPSDGFAFSSTETFIPRHTFSAFQKEFVSQEIQVFLGRCSPVWVAASIRLSRRGAEAYRDACDSHAVCARRKLGGSPHELFGPLKAEIVGSPPPPPAPARFGVFSAVTFAFTQFLSAPPETIAGTSG
jgi:hypothetical protein